MYIENLEKSIIYEMTYLHTPSINLFRFNVDVILGEDIIGTCVILKIDRK